MYDTATHGTPVIRPQGKKATAIKGQNNIGRF